MRKRLMMWLSCPLCSGNLDLHSATVSRAPASDTDRRVLSAVAPIADADQIDIDITTGALSCASCRVYYPIFNSVPRMLTYWTKVAGLHAEENAAWVKEELIGFALPASPVPPGEQEVLRNFSTEWTRYKWSGKSYWSATPARVLDWMRFSLGTSRHTLRGKLALDAGMGIGGIADGLSRSEDCEIIGLDLSYAVDQASAYFGRNCRLHIVQASIFALPFRPGSFDVVYSQGVLHHAYSAEKAFARLAQAPKHDGMLYVWVYSPEDEKATVLRRVLMVVEGAFRPLLSRLPTGAQTVALAPAVIPYILYQNVIRRRKFGRDEATTYGWSEAMHAARDRLTPAFASRHTYEEVAEWFSSQNYKYLELLRNESLPAGFPATLQRCVGIRGFRETPKG